MASTAIKPARRVGPRQVARFAILLALAASIAWGVRVWILEGFVYEWPRHFTGDFYNAMFGAWSSQGIHYGPVFVMEHWLVTLAPSVFNEYFFAVLNVPLLLLALFFATRAARLGGVAAILGVAAWVCFQWVPYAFSVAANPEMVELMLLCAAWFAVSRRTSLGLTATVAAAMTKRIPIVFLPLVIIAEPTRRSIAVLGVVGLVGVAVLSLGQHTGPDALARTTLNSAALLLQQTDTSGYRALPKDDLADILAQPFPYPSQFLGLSNALARLFGRSINDWTLPFFQGFYYMVTLGVLGFATYLAFALLRGPRRIPRMDAEILSFGIFFALMPLTAITTHPHTFIFVLPTWTAIVALVALDPNVWRKRALAALAAGCYFFIGFPTPVVLLDRYLGTDIWFTVPFQDPIWANLVLLFGLFAYGTTRLHDHATAVTGTTAGSGASIGRRSKVEATAGRRWFRGVRADPQSAKVRTSESRHDSSVIRSPYGP